jgi:hypothetical protein
MNMAAAAGALKQPRYKNVARSKNDAAYRAVARAAAIQAVDAASYMHKPVFAAVERRKSSRADQLSPVQAG